MNLESQITYLHLQALRVECGNVDGVWLKLTNVSMVECPPHVPICFPVLATIYFSPPVHCHFVFVISLHIYPLISYDFKLLLRVPLVSVLINTITGRLCQSRYYSKRRVIEAKYVVRTLSEHVLIKDVLCFWLQFEPKNKTGKQNIKLIYLYII